MFDFLDKIWDAVPGVKYAVGAAFGLWFFYLIANAALGAIGHTLPAFYGIGNEFLKTLGTFVGIGALADVVRNAWR